MSEEFIKIAVLEQKVTDLKEFILKVDEAIDKISEVNINLTKMIAVHEQRFEAREVVEKNIHEKVDNLYLKMEKDHNNVIEEIKKISSSIEKVETNLNNRLSNVEKDQSRTNIKIAVVIFGALFLGFIIQNSSFFSKMLSNAHLTNKQESAIVEKPR